MPAVPDVRPRSGVVLELLTGALAGLGPAPLRVVDAGGGAGGVAVPLAALGHEVLVVDPSPDAIAGLRRRAEERADGCTVRIRGVQGDLTELAGLVPAGGADVVVCHDVLGAVDDPDEALRAVAAALRPGGLASVLVPGRGGTVLARAVAGRIAEAAALLEADRADERGLGRYDVRGLHAALTGAGLEVTATHGVRVFSDLVSGHLLEQDPALAPALAALERAVVSDPQFLPVAGRLHCFARRPG